MKRGAALQRARAARTRERDARVAPGLVAGLLLALGCSRPLAPAPGSDIVLIVVDTLRADAILDAAGRVATPRIDELAADGIVFPRAYSHAPMTLPSHTSLFSSRPPFETGVLINGQRVPPELPLLPEWLHRHGYQTRAVLSLGTMSPHADQGLDRGFDVYDLDFWGIAQAGEVMQRLRGCLEGFEEGTPRFLFAHFSDPHAPYNAHGSVIHEARLHLDGKQIARLSTSDAQLLDRWIDLAQGRHALELRSVHPFQVQTAHVAGPGGKLELTWEEGDRGKFARSYRIAFDVPTAGDWRLRLRLVDAIGTRGVRKRYVGEVEFVDGFVGELIDALRASGRYESSLIVLTSDHGEELDEERLHGQVGHVETLHDELLHVPLILKPPAAGRHAAILGEVREELVTLCDLTPTILEIVGLPPLPDQRGTSLLHRSERVLIAETHRPQAARDLVCLQDERFKLIYHMQGDAFEMYDLEADPGERSDVFASRGHERRLWQERLRGIARSVRALGGDALELDPETRETLRALGYGGS